MARICSNKEDSEFYAGAFKAIFKQCEQYHKEFGVGKSLKGIVMDWSDTERSGLQTAVGKELCDKVIVGCHVHYGRSYQHVADKVNNSLPREYRQLSRSAFGKIASCIPSQKEKSIVMKLFDVLKGALVYQAISFVRHFSAIASLRKIGTLKRSKRKNRWKIGEEKKRKMGKNLSIIRQGLIILPACMHVCIYL